MDFYDRRIRPKDEIAVLESIGENPYRLAGEHLTPSSHPQAWKAFERMLAVIHEQALPGEFTVTAYRAWIARYPKEVAEFTANSWIISNGTGSSSMMRRN